MYIIGIDIAKRFHEAAIIDKAGEIVVKRIRFDNSRSGFLKLMEATGHYWLPLYAHLRQDGQIVHVINPLQSDALRELCRQRFFIVDTAYDFKRKIIALLDRTQNYCRRHLL